MTAPVAAPGRGGQAESAASARALWIAALAGPLAWLLDEAIALVVEARVCAGPVQSPRLMIAVLLVFVAVAALAAVIVGVITARRALHALDGADVHRSRRMRFIARSGMLLSALAGYGIVLRLLTSLVSPGCA